MALTSDIAYSSAIAADDFNQTEVDNLRAAKLDDATTPWTSASNITSGTLTNISAVTPTADAHVATKAYVDAATPPLYIVTTRLHCFEGYGAGSNAYCPSGWSVVTSWIYAVNHDHYGCVYSTAARDSYGHNSNNSGCEYNLLAGGTQTLCLKN